MMAYKTLVGLITGKRENKDRQDIKEISKEAITILIDNKEQTIDFDTLLEINQIMML